jgi:hypothetical protein
MLDSLYWEMDDVPLQNVTHAINENWESISPGAEARTYLRNKDNGKGKYGDSSLRSE